MTLVVQREEPRTSTWWWKAPSSRPPGPLPEALLNTAIRYLGEEGGHAFARSMEGVDEVLFTVRPDRWLSADFTGDL